LQADLICFGAIHFSQDLTPGFLNLKPVSTLIPGPVTGPDFAAAAEIAQKVVVLIEASESEATAKTAAGRIPFRISLNDLVSMRTGLDTAHASVRSRFWRDHF
jgi:hypothetical protein